MRPIDAGSAPPATDSQAVSIEDETPGVGRKRTEVFEDDDLPSSVTLAELVKSEVEDNQGSTSDQQAAEGQATKLEVHGKPFEITLVDVDPEEIAGTDLETPSPSQSVEVGRSTTLEVNERPFMVTLVDVDPSAIAESSLLSSPPAQAVPGTLSNGLHGAVEMNDGSIEEQTPASLEDSARLSLPDDEELRDQDSRVLPGRIKRSRSSSPSINEGDISIWDGKLPNHTVEVRIPPLPDTLPRKKRRLSPPWQFKPANTTTIKLSDGRRSSARVNTSASGTPDPSETGSQRTRHSIAASSRRSSPPWRDFKAEGPSSVQVDGVRKSGRVNKLADTPKRVSPRSKKRAVQPDEPSPPSVVNVKRTRKPSTIVRELQAQIDELKQQKKSALKRDRTSSSGAVELDDSSPVVSPQRKRKARDTGAATRSTPRLKLRLSSPRQTIYAPHPLAYYTGPTRPPLLSVWQQLDEIDLREKQQPYLENERGPPTREELERRIQTIADQEAGMRQRIMGEGQLDGALSSARCSIYNEPLFQFELPKRFAHVDHLVSHATFFRSLQLKEQTAHRQIAKKIAHEALDYWKKKQGPTQEDLEIEAIKTHRLVAKQVVADMKAKWDLVWQYVDAHRRAIWEHDQEIRRQEKLQRQLAWSEQMIAKQRGQLGSEHEDSLLDEDDDENAFASMSESDNTVNSDAETSDEDENMSDEGTSSNESDANGELDDVALQEYLAQRQAEPPDTATPHESDATEHAAVGTADAHIVPPSAGLSAELSSQPDDASTDESIDMDSEDYSEDESGEESDDNNASDSEGSANSDLTAPKTGLLGFFSKSDRLAKGLPTPVTSAEGEDVAERDQDHRDSHSPMQQCDGDDVQDLNTAKHPAVSSLQTRSRPDTPTSQSASDQISKQLIPAPTLLQGTLRSYQHAGVDWLASLYRNNTNGILADEMGLGKTIQTISLFAHIAEVHDVWDTHLVIVPTSVVLNWVTEFQKFLPGFRVLGYYGSGEERQAKRRFWTNDPHHENREKRGYNVIVTSYNIALKDITSLRTVQWHYMVLDEAHNIRNFNSQRFQNLIKLKTRARLLLTGTPLQNSLTELWSLLTFLTAGRDSDDGAAHGSLEEFLSRWKEPVNEIFERGVQSLSDEASKVVSQLHTSLRPFMLRRLKADVEKDLPKKTEHVVVCKLSKRQRELYQDYMGLADTRAKLTQGNAISAGKVLLSLRRVCNHPDLFDPRPVQTSYALEKSPLEPYAALETLIRGMLGERQPEPDKFMLTKLESEGQYRRRRGRQISASRDMYTLVQVRARECPDGEADLTTISGARMMLQIQQKRDRLAEWRQRIQHNDDYFSAKPIYGSDLREHLTIRSTRASSGCSVLGRLQIFTSDTLTQPTLLTNGEAVADKMIARSTLVQNSVRSVEDRAQAMLDTITRYSFCTPEVTAPVLRYVLPERTQKGLRAIEAYPGASDPMHESRSRLSISFPDSRLLVYDSGKLQRLTTLLRDLQSRGSRSLIFSQMSGTLNILEQFLGLMGLPYLRLDGSTPVERRQLYSAEFNRPDSKYQCMILSSRAGGVGLNLTGASSVIFYDLDWNPQMDRQCMDRAHRIGQVRDVEVYKLVSEKTVEENILRRANQKSLLDQTVIQEGHFTTDYDMPQAEKSGDDVSAAIDRFLSGAEKNFTKTIETIEDKEDVQAAQQARKEDMQDEEDFAERSSKGPSMPPTPGVEEIDMNGHVDAYMIRYLEDAVKHIPYVPPVVTTRDPSHRRKKRTR